MHLEIVDGMIANKRAQLARAARSLASDMERLAVRAEDIGSLVPDCPIQHAATNLNTLCGEINALIESRKILAHAIAPKIDTDLPPSHPHNIAARAAATEGRP